MDNKWLISQYKEKEKLRFKQKVMAKALERMDPGIEVVE